MLVRTHSRPFRTLSVVDEANREGLAIAVGTLIPAARVVRVMEQLGEMYGLPHAVRVDNGPEFLAAAFQDWCAEHGIEIPFIQAGKPNQNAFVEATSTRVDRIPFYSLRSTCAEIP